MGMGCQSELLENNNNCWHSVDKNLLFQDEDDNSMRRKSVSFTHYDDCTIYEYDNSKKSWSLPERSKLRRTEPPEIVISIKESLHRLRTLLEEKRAWDTDVANGNSPVSPSLNIPLNFRFKSIVELSEAARRRTVARNMTTRIRTDESSPSTLHEEHQNLSMKEVAYCNGNGIYHNHIRKDSSGTLSQSPVIHEPEDIQQISPQIKVNNKNESELQKSGSELKKLEDQISTLQDEKELPSDEKGKLTNTAVKSDNKGDFEVASGSRNSQFSKEGTQVDGKEPVRRPKTVWRSIKKTSSRVFFGLLESWF